ncbi:nitrate reductase cytochrome c-type subunit [Bradyrhizobium japonicum]|uniref:nitrate reductase cytochrome c-type subunit n=1 Tax=Bradyrhizobium japonicum TaxID=375 RepID=UPI0003FB4DBB|nr:nitrate reductase cytochrome c-type subunit [Bradyrhizobium japonicum]
MTFVRLIPLIAAAAVAVALVIPFAASGPLAQEAKQHKALREAPLTEMSPPPEVTKQSVPASGFERAYRQQPPLIPHKVDGYQITTENNACMGCHDWPGNTRVNAPKISETHYVDRQGVRLDKVAGTRYFCQQCHVPQADAKPLVGNIFKNATQAK